MSAEAPGCGSNSEARKRQAEATTPDAGVMSGLTDDERREIGPWNHRLLEATVADMLAAREAKARKDTAERIVAALDAEYARLYRERGDSYTEGYLDGLDRAERIARTEGNRA